ncbi:MAG: NUDIX domain-containing protein [Bacteroidota bacterium]
MYKVFVYGKPVYLTNDLSYFQNIPHNHKSVFTNAEDLGRLIKKIRVGKTVEEYIIYSFDLNELWMAFTSLFMVIDAGGGIIRNQKGELLFIFRKGKWDLPKGKIEIGETIADGAVREVKEECGLTQVELGKLLTTTYHTYTQGNKKILKQSHWYEMTVPNGQKLVPQLEEDITEIRWIKPTQLKEVRNNTFKSITDLLDQFAG